MLLATPPVSHWRLPLATAAAVRACVSATRLPAAALRPYLFMIVKNTIKASAKKERRKKKKKTALVISRDRKQFWTTQAQFWQWVREGVVVKSGDEPLSGNFVRENEENLVLLSNTVLNLAHPNHLREALLSRRNGLAGR